jgi:D-alanyl-lipoteichoic acid acyltransferase DltB (MBOAT superfamily)
MNFADLQFWVFLSAILAVALILRQGVKAVAPSRLRLFDHLALAATNLTLFFNADARSCVILLIELFLTYSLIRLALRRGRATRFVCLVVLIGLHIAVLVYFKYAAFFVHDILGLAWQAAPRSIPAGISFYTFQKLALAIDTIRNEKPLPRLLDFFNYSTFFPQLVAGPIERRDALLPQIEGFSFGLRLAHLEKAVPLLVLGLFYKLVLADNIAVYDMRAVQDNAYAIWLTTFLFGLRIYFDFSGYSFIALGLAKAFGVNLTLNFRAPYASQDIREFWQRWHITLSTWFRDYLYRPLGGNRSGSWEFNIAAVFIVSGLWHGAGFNFLCWGALHALAMVVFGWYSRRGYPFPRRLAWPVTMAFILFSWLFFYETSFSALAHKLTAMASPSAYSGARLNGLVAMWGVAARIPLLFTICLSLFFLWIEYRNRSLPNPYQPLLDWRVSCALAAGVAILAASADSQFIYFAF